MVRRMRARLHLIRFDFRTTHPVPVFWGGKNGIEDMEPYLMGGRRRNQLRRQRWRVNKVSSWLIPGHSNQMAQSRRLPPARASCIPAKSEASRERLEAIERIKQSNK